MDNEEYAKMVMKEAKSREILVGDCGPSPIEDIPVIEPDDSPLMRMYKEAKQKAFVTDTSQMEREHQVDALRYTCGGIANFMGPTKEEGNMTATGMRANEPREPRKMWSLYQVIAVDKGKIENIVPEIDRKVIAKNTEHAKGLAGVNDLLEKYNYDNTKLAVRVSNILDIRPVEDDE
jgi:hypothetical protein